MKQELVQDWMTREVITITPDTSLKEAHEIMTRAPVTMQQTGRIGEAA